MRLLLAGVAAVGFALAQNGPTDLTGWLNARAQRFLAERRTTVRAIATADQARARQTEVRRKLLELLNGLPDYKGPLNARTTGKLDENGYVVEKVIYDSLPRFPVTANLYLPKTAGKHPAILFSMGHWLEGKPAAQVMAANLARKGFVVLVYDPIGQGERQQFWDARLGEGLPGGSVNQHFTAGAEAVLAGETFARYMIHDGRRGIDYLESRPEVDAGRIGATGCSGGGTQTTFIAALDDRVKAAAPACYIQSFELLFTGSIGDSEQSWPGFLSAGLDQSDFVELFAPKPWLMASTEGDFFTPAAAKLVFDEARGFYRSFGAEDRVRWVVGPGGHGTPLVVREAIYEWFIRWLNAGQGSAKEEPVRLHPDHDLWATKTGQVAADLGARGIQEIIRENWKHGALTKPAPLAPLPGVPRTRLMRESSTDGAEVEHLLMETEPGFEIAATWYRPRSRPTGKMPVVLMVEPARPAEALRRGHAVLAIWTRGTPGPAPGSWNRYFGNWEAATRSWLVGLSLPEMRARDIDRAIAWLRARPDVGDIRATASGVAGLWLLRGGLVDGVKRVWLDRTPASICSAIGLELHHDLHEAAHPGMCRQHDWTLLRDERVLWSDPVDWMRHVQPGRGAGYFYRHFEQGDGALWDQFLR